MDILIDYNTMNFSLNQIKQMISNQYYYKYFKTLPSDENIENDNRGVPKINKFFYGLFIRFKRIPTWKEVYDYYTYHWCEWCINGNMTFKKELRDKYPRFDYTFNPKALEHKILNTYMSLLKEVYILYWLFDKGITTAYYSLKTDKDGFDIMLTNRFNYKYGFKIYVDTKRAKSFANIKTEERNKLPEETVSISIRVQPSNKTSLQIGDTFVPTDKTLNGIYHYINNNIRKDIII